MGIISVFDIFFSAILVFFLLGRARTKVAAKIETNPYYKYYSKGLLAKLVGAILFCLIYAVYYQGGDTINYFKGVQAMNAVLVDNPVKYLEVLFTNKEENWWIFYDVGVFPPKYMFKDPRTFMVIKMTSLVSIFGLGGYLQTSIILSSIVYVWVWKLFLFTVNRYPQMVRELTFSFLYLPSVIFWGSGILKDTYTFTATCYLVYGLNQIFIVRKGVFRTLIGLLISIVIIISIKSYILFAVLPGGLIFLNFERIKKIESSFLKILVLPIAIVVLVGILNTIFFENSEVFGKYAGEKIFEEAAIQQSDLKREVYGGNSFDIGEFDPSLAGGLSKFHLALNAALFRPYIWEVATPTMVISGLENLFFLLFTLWVLLVRGPIKILQLLRNDPFVLFCLLFTIILGFGVGLSTANFGALVRYKLPFLPFFTFLLFRIYQVNKIGVDYKKNMEEYKETNLSQ